MRLQLRRRAVVLAAVPVLALSLAACGENGGAGAGPSKSAMSDQDKRLKWAKCMRDNGVQVEVKPDGGMLTKREKSRTGGDEGPSDSESDEAMKKCRHLLPDGGEPPKPSAADVAKLREFAKCMRAHGIDMPDPGPDGRILIERREGDGVSKKEMEDAQRACRKHMPSPPGGRR
ncbi:MULTISPECIES: hypothetical protein [Thermomonospora]|uniref:Putative small secreted protein n=1 Tax=Thermomonospora cellulosilytica TaxID=1411118 RepID=A0A7W3R8Y0_9ACTN|nr:MULTISPECIES: hypothetical protein [Thermomonospora]MBA9004768.1 putative small secreted protein [Thermomonospora cellulosilytica]